MDYLGKEETLIVVETDLWAVSILWSTVDQYVHADTHNASKMQMNRLR